MTRTIYTKRCPHCQKLLYRSNEKHPKIFGNSMRRCPYCFKSYMDSDVYEWVNLTKEEKKSVLVFGADMAILRESELKTSYTRWKYTQFLLITIPVVITIRKRLRALETFKFSAEMLQDSYIRESIERTKDSDYLKFLIMSGRNYYGTEYEKAEA